MKRRLLYGRPDGPFRLNQDSAAAQGLSLWIPLNGDFRLRGIGQPSDVNPTLTSVGRDGHPEGSTVAVFDSGTDKMDFGSTVLDGADNSGRFTLSAWVNIRTLDNPTTGRQWVSRWGTTAATRRWLLSQKDSDGANLRFATGNGTSIVVFDSTGSPLAANSRNLVTVVWTGSLNPKMRFYVNGIETGRSSLVDQGITTIGTATTNLTIGANANAGTSCLLADVCEVMFWGQRALSDKDIWRLWEPTTRWDHYWVPNQRIMVFVGGGAYSIVAAAGSFAIGGTAAGLNAGRKVAASPGAYVMAGTNAGLVPARRVAASPGSVAMTGTAALLKAARALVASPGSVALTGTAANLKAARLAVEAGGSFVVTGTAATLSIGKLMSAGPGALTVTGVAAALRVARRITASPGTVVVAGTAASLIPPGNRLTASAGGVTVTGTAASLKIGRSVAAVSGSFTWTGTAAALRRAARATASPGAVSVTGLVAALSAARRVAATGGSVTLSAPVASLILARALNCAPGSVAFVGQTALLTWSAEAHVKIYLEGEAVLSIDVAGEYAPSINVAGDTGYLN